MSYRNGLAALSWVLFALGATLSKAAVPVSVVNADLKALIRAAAPSPVQFAVHVAHAASPGTTGTWSQAKGISTWRYAVRVPTAVSMSFHAAPAYLPAGAILTVRSAASTMTYRMGDIRHHDFWSRIHPGDTLELTLTVPTAERSLVALQIVSLQAGYRGLGPGVQDHPYYRQLKQLAATNSGPGATDNSACVQNYMCNAVPGNAPIGQASVALTVLNQYQCTGTLINDVPQDNTPYVLTARHCEGGSIGGGAPGNASSVTVYWDATTPCGQTLGTIYDPGIVTQTGATTVVEQQDAWLIELADSPVVSDAQFAGFDASGAAVSGGYTVHHARAYDKQFVSWYGQALAVQANVGGTSYQPNYLEVVNQSGNIGLGASGSGLINQNNRLVGSLTLGNANDASGYGMCPVSPLAAPSGSNGVGLFTDLSAVWNSTADTSSSTGSTTLKSVLDPANSGTLVMASSPAAQISFASSSLNLTDGQSATLSWTVPKATGCMASGGVNGDSWSGALPPSGSQSVTETVGITVTYLLSCALSGGGRASAKLLISWYGSVPFVQVYADRSYVWTTRPATVTWTSNVTPCSISGGSVSLTNQSSSGLFTATQNSPGEVIYQVTCGSGNVAASGSAVVSFVTPSLTLQANATDRLLGQQLGLQWLTYADTCVPSGGAPNDGWANNSLVSQTDAFWPRVTTLGTYTYTLTCTSGALSVTQSVQVTVEDNAPYVTASLSPASTTYTASPADYVTINWTTNLSTCVLNSTPVLGNGVGPPQLIPNESGFIINGPEIVAPEGPGTYTVTISCNGVGASPVTSAPMTVTVLHPPPPTANISVTPSSITQGGQYTVAWSSNYTSNCSPTGDAAVWNFGSPTDVAVSGSQVISPYYTGQYTVGITCRSIDGSQSNATAQTTITVTPAVPPAVSITVSPAQVAIGQSFTVSWSSSNATSCTASGGGADGSIWSGTLSTTGTTTQTASNGGSFTYSISCLNVDFSASAQAPLTVTILASSKGGGGALTLMELAGLSGLLLYRRKVHRRLPRGTCISLATGHNPGSSQTQCCEVASAQQL